MGISFTPRYYLSRDIVDSNDHNIKNEQIANDIAEAYRLSAYSIGYANYLSDTISLVDESTLRYIRETLNIGENTSVLTSQSSNVVYPTSIKPEHIADIEQSTKFITLHKLIQEQQLFSYNTDLEKNIPAQGLSIKRESPNALDSSNIVTESTDGPGMLINHGPPYIVKVQGETQNDLIIYLKFQILLELMKANTLSIIPFPAIGNTMIDSISFTTETDEIITTKWYDNTTFALDKTNIANYTTPNLITFNPIELSSLKIKLQSNNKIGINNSNANNSLGYTGNVSNFSSAGNDKFSSCCKPRKTEKKQED